MIIINVIIAEILFTSGSSSLRVILQIPALMVFIKCVNVTHIVWLTILNIPDDSLLLSYLMTHYEVLFSVNQGLMESRNTRSFYFCLCVATTPAAKVDTTASNIWMQLFSSPDYKTELNFNTKVQTSERIYAQVLNQINNECEFATEPLVFLSVARRFKRDLLAEAARLLASAGNL